MMASNIGSLANVVSDGVTGLLFRPGDVGDLEEKLMGLINDRRRLEEMRRAARMEYKAKYTGNVSIQKLERLYRLRLWI